MRVFVGIPLAINLQQQILQWQQEHDELPVRWIKPKNLHITLVPPWYETNITVLREKLQAVSVAPFQAAFTQVSFGPPNNFRLIWTTGKTPQEFFQLQANIHERLHQKPEKRSLTMHSTIARFPPSQFSSFPIKTVDEKVIWGMPITLFALFRVHLSSKGADYEILETIHFLS